MQDYSWQKYTKTHDGVREYLKKHNSIVVAALYGYKTHYVVYYNNDYDISIQASYDKELNGQKFRFIHLSSFLLALAHCQAIATNITKHCQFAMNGFDSAIKNYIQLLKENQTQAGKLRGLFNSITTILLSSENEDSLTRLKEVFANIKQLVEVYEIDQAMIASYLTKDVEQILSKDIEQLSSNELDDFIIALLKCSDQALSSLQREKVKERLDIDYMHIVEEIAKINWKIQLGD